MGMFERIKIRERETFHLDREKLGDKFEMPTLDQVDGQRFMDRFAKTEKQEKPVVQSAASAASVEKDRVLSHLQMIEMRNEYESKLI